jgi:hypothetical protein
VDKRLEKSSIHNYFDLDDKEVSDLIGAINSPESIPLEIIGSGAYHVVVRPSPPDSSSQYAVKILKKDKDTQNLLLDSYVRIRWDEYAGYLDKSLIDASVGTFAHADPEGRMLLAQLLEQALELQTQRNYLGEFIVPGKYAIISLTTPVIASKAHFAFSEHVDKDPIKESELLTLPSGQRGYIFSVFNSLTKGSRMKIFFEIDEHGIYEQGFAVACEPGLYVAEVQRLLPSPANEDNAQVRLIETTLLNLHLNREVWDVDFTDQLILFISRLMKMAEAGISGDPAYLKPRSDNIIIYEENGKKQIGVIDTNNTVINLNLLAQKLGEDEIPLPGIPKANADAQLLGFVHGLLISVNIAKMEIPGLLSEGSDRIIADLISKLEQEVLPDEHLDAIERYNSHIVEERAALQVEINALDIRNSQVKGPTWVKKILTGRDVKRARALYERFMSLGLKLRHPNIKAEILNVLKGIKISG